MNSRIFSFFCALVFCFILGYQHYKDLTKKNPKAKLDKMLLDSLPIGFKKGGPPEKPQIIYKERIVEKPIYILATATSKLPLDLNSTHPVNPPNPNSLISPLVGSQTVPIPDSTPMASGTQGQISQSLASGSKTLTAASKKTKGEAQASQTTDLNGEGILSDLEGASDWAFNLGLKSSKGIKNPFLPGPLFIPKIPLNTEPEKVQMGLPDLPSGVTVAAGEVAPKKTTSELQGLYIGSISTFKGADMVRTALMGRRAYGIGEVFSRGKEDVSRKILEIKEDYVLLIELENPNNYWFAWSTRLSGEVLQKYKTKFLNI